MRPGTAALGVPEPCARAPAGRIGAGRSFASGPAGAALRQADPARSRAGVCGGGGTVLPAGPGACGVRASGREAQGRPRTGRTGTGRPPEASADGARGHLARPGAAGESVPGARRGGTLAGRTRRPCVRT
ncbi:hypothetical protein SCWH03_46450 [Streptomyces pacificus]|uniref:Uncharacterized protein n=1 Tax=Streptomyces pacificus TaxID=2705029 RepID=A0A6A0B118_9ACTN|nr:hypothetical protein SCWH03_46450 [Streptomyces pacificus]